MEYGFKKIFWGLILISFHINIAYFDILPDFIGFYLIYIGCNSLKDEENSFTKACMPALVLAIIYLLGVAYSISPMPQVETSLLGEILSVLWSLAVRIINIIIVYHICIGVYKISIRFDNRFLKNRSKWILNCTLITFVLAEIGTSFLLNGKTDVLGITITILLIFRFILNLFLIRLVHSSSKNFIVN